MADQHPLVSIITIVFNSASHLEKSIQSVLSQTYPYSEYIIIDGGSTDGSVDIIKKYESRLAYWVSEEDKGISDAFNKGIARAKGEIVGIINADDWYEKDAIEKVITHARDVDIVYGDLRLWKNGERDFIVKGSDTYLPMEMTVNHPTVFVRRNCYQKFGLFDEKYKCAMDYELMLRFKFNECRFGYVPSVLSNMNWGGWSDAEWILGCRETLAIKNKYLPHRRIRNLLYFYKQVLAIALPKFLARFKLGFITRFYRSQFSKVKKVYE